MGKNRKSSDGKSGGSINPNITSEVQKELDELVKDEGITYTITENGVTVERNGIVYEVGNVFLENKRFSINGNTPETLKKVFTYYDEFPKEIQTVNKINLISDPTKNPEVFGYYKPSFPNEITLLPSILSDKYYASDGNYNSFRYMMYHESAHSLDYSMTKSWDPFTESRWWMMANAGKEAVSYYGKYAYMVGGNPDHENFAEMIAIQATYEVTGRCDNIQKATEYSSDEVVYKTYEDWHKSNPDYGKYDQSYEWVDEVYQLIKEKYEKGYY